MLESLPRLLAELEPTISSIVGLFTLGAAVWGVLRLTARARRGNAAQETSLESARPVPGPWDSLFSFGVSEHSQLEELVSVRAVNVVLFCLLMLSLPWLIVCLLLIHSVPLTLITLGVFTGSLLGFALQRAGATTAARWLVIFAVSAYWLGIMLVVGPMQGTEYFLGALMSLPVLILSRAQTAQRLLSVALIAGVFALGVALTRGQAPSPVLTEGMLTVGYHVNALFLAAIIVVSVSYYKAFAATSYEMLASKKQANDALVSRLIPAELAQRMTDEDTTAAHWHPEGTVLVARLTGFTELYARLPAIEIVSRLDELYSRFDDIIETNGVDKVKTLGTTYVAAAGLGGSGESYAPLATSALALRHAVEDFARQHELPIAFRATLATGLTISGVIGKARPRFDIWGEALDAATLLQATAGEGDIIVNDTAYWRLHRRFEFLRLETPEPSYRLIAEQCANELAS